MKEEEGVIRKSSLPVEEDMRKLEDTVEIINRRQITEVDSKVTLFSHALMCMLELTYM